MYSSANVNDQQRHSPSAPANYPRKALDPRASDYSTVALLYLNHHPPFDGPISAPAVSSNSEDYFSFVILPDDTPRDSGDSAVADDSLHYHQMPPKAKIIRQKRRTLSTNKIRHRLNLSHSYVSESPALDSFNLALASDLETHHRNEELSPVLGASIRKTTRKKPSFRLMLDDLTPSSSPIHKIQQQTSFMSPMSDPGHDKHRETIALYEPDAFLQQGASGRVDHFQEDITPLMFPPNSEDFGYFGEFSQLADKQISGGYINVSSKIGENANSDIESFLNFPVDEIIPYPRDSFRPYDDVDQRVEARFTPIQNSQDAAFHSYDQARFHEPHNAEEHFHDQGFSGYPGDFPPQAPGQFNHGVNPQFANRKPTEMDPFQSNDPNYEIQTYSQNEHHARGQHQPPSSFHAQDGQRHIHGESNHNGAPHLHMPQSFQQESHPRPAEVYGHRKLPSPGDTRHRPDIEGYGLPQYDAQHHQPAPQHQDFVGERHATKPDEPHVVKTEGNDAAPESHTDFSVGVDKDKAGPTKKKRGVNGVVCSICDKFISRDFSRHMRIHDEAGRFQCVFPAVFCKHKSRKFNRPYDYKKHLLNIHFIFDDPAAKLAPNLTEKLMIEGQCSACEQRFIANEWLENHIVSTNENTKCYGLDHLVKLYLEESREERPKVETHKA